VSPFLAQMDILTTQKNQIIATRHVSLAHNYQNCFFRPGLHSGIFQRSLRPLTGFQEEEEREGKKVRGTGGWGKEGLEFCQMVQLSTISCLR